MRSFSFRSQERSKSIAVNSETKLFLQSARNEGKVVQYASDINATQRIQISKSMHSQLQRENNWRTSKFAIYANGMNFDLYS